MPGLYKKEWAMAQWFEAQAQSPPISCPLNDVYSLLFFLQQISTRQIYILHELFFTRWWQQLCASEIFIKCYLMSENLLVSLVHEQEESRKISFISISGSRHFSSKEGRKIWFNFGVLVSRDPSAKAVEGKAEKADDSRGKK